LWLLVFGGAYAAQSDALPDAPERDRILKLMREYAASYHLPDVMYDQMLTLSRRPSGSETWRTVWMNESRRIAHDGREYLCCRLGKHNKPAPNQWVQSWYVPGSDTFPWDGSKASLVWNRWDVVRGHRVAVFDYSVTQQDSHFIMPYFRDKAVIPRLDGAPYSGPVTDLRNSAVLPYAGSMWVDPSTGAIWRLSMQIGEFPARFKIKHSSAVTDFDLVTLGTTQYLLKVADVEVLPYSADTDRCERLYSNYRKFEADSSVTFFGVDSTINYRH
jgi:hypothetical protein